MKISAGVLVCVLLLAGLVTGQVVVSGGYGSGGGMSFTYSVPGNVDSQNRPFSADIINESTQLLLDGNRIHQESHGKVFRDSQGRTRNEVAYPSGLTGSVDFKHISIFDPVQKRIISLQPRDKTATISHFDIPRGTLNSAPQRPATNAPLTQTVLPKSSEKMEDLGTKDIEGVTASGKRLTRTIPAGQFGNEEPLVIVTDTWFSPDLQTIVLSETDDPRSGHHVMKLVNIQRTEPDPALFDVPADYTVKDQNRQ